jgi:hypothetical protein
MLTTPSSAVKSSESDDSASSMVQHEAIFPGIITETVQRKLQAVRDKCRSVIMTLAPFDSKINHTSILVLDGTISPDIEATKENLWLFLMELCAEFNAPMNSKRMYRDFWFLGGFLNQERVNLLIMCIGNTVYLTPQQMRTY